MEPDLVDEPLSLRTVHARRAADAMAALAYATGSSRPVPPPEAAALLGEVSEALLRISDALRGIGNGLRQSIDTHGVTGADGESANIAMIRAQALLQGAADASALIVDDVWEARDTAAPFGVTRVPATSDDVVSF
jgi:hypothetical protein